MADVMSTNQGVAQNQLHVKNVAESNLYGARLKCSALYFPLLLRNVCCNPPRLDVDVLLVVRGEIHLRQATEEDAQARMYPTLLQPPHFGPIAGALGPLP